MNGYSQDRIVANLAMWECDVCHCTTTASSSEVAKLGWKVHKLADHDPIVECDDCAADMAKRRKRTAEAQASAKGK